MKPIVVTVLTLCLVASLPLQAQKVIDKVADQTCACLQDFRMEKEAEIIRDVITRCVEVAVKANEKAMTKTFPSLYGNKAGASEIGKMISRELKSNCPDFVALNSRLDGSNQTAQEWFDTAEKYAAEGEAQKAEAAYSRAIQLSPGSGICYNRRGLVRQSMGDQYGALADFMRAVELSDYKSVDAYGNLANTKNTLGDEESALKDIEQAIELEPENDFPHQVRGHILSAMGEYAASEASYRRGAALDTENLYSFYNLGRLFFEQELNDSALLNFDKALAMGGTDDPDIYNYRGLTYARLNDDRKAIADFNAAIRLDDDDPAHYFNRAVSYKGLGMYDSAYADFSYSIEIEPDAPENYYERADLLGRMERFEDAIADYSQTLALSPKRASAMDGRAAAKTELGDLQGALEDYNASLELFPNDEYILYRRGMIKLELNDIEGACEDLKRASALKSEEAKAELKQRDCGC